MKTSEQSMNNWPKIHAPTCGTFMSEAQKKAHVRNTPPHVHRVPPVGAGYSPVLYQFLTALIIFGLNPKQKH